MLGESGANDPSFNLRREPLLLQRVDAQASTTFYGVLEPHGQYDGTAETVRGANSRIDRGPLPWQGRQRAGAGLAGGQRVALGIADDPSKGGSHEVSADGQRWNWSGGWKRFDTATGKDGK